jgi:tRNA uridine 5-carboxymethylaminomethyl modification enzyme
MEKYYDIIVIGGGHAGTEAAWAAARMGCSVLLVTMRIDAIGRMSCNPAIGGLGKGQIVREIDALGGLMALATDRGGIQFRMLNRSKGPAVWAPRAQADRVLYAAAVQELLGKADGLDIVEGVVDRLPVGEGCGAGEGERGGGGERDSGTEGWRDGETEGQSGEGVGESFVDAKSEIRNPRLHIRGVRLQDGREFSCKAAIITTGTFLKGLMHCGEQKAVGGRIGEQAAVTLSDELARLGFTLGRLKTGTPPRVHRDSIDYGRITPQPGDDPPVPFSYLTERIGQPQIQCWITHTNERTHELIRANLDRAPMYSGQIQSRGPRYCPSIEDKVVRFAEKSAHQVFLEPEGYDSDWVYCNGISTSLPRDVQDELVHSIVGLESARIVQYGYAVEYDWVPTDQIDSTLQTKRVAGLYLAGQINGTSGYEEAAGQGMLAGINAAARILGGGSGEAGPASMALGREHAGWHGPAEPYSAELARGVVFGRDQAYIGVMIDDIVTRPPDEPYRMFTSRAEYRLHLRSDNADARLTPFGRRLGLVDDRRWAAFERKQAAIEALEARLHRLRIDGQSAFDLLRRPDATLAELCGRFLELATMLAPSCQGKGTRAPCQGGDGEGVVFSPDVLEEVEIRAKYAGYLEREQRLVDRYRQLEARTIPESFDYAAIPDLRFEAREKFTRVRPRSIGQAGRISGISPADIATLYIHLTRKS